MLNDKIRPGSIFNFNSYLVAKQTIVIIIKINTLFTQQNTGMFPSISVFHMAGIICQVSLYHWIKDECQFNFFFSKMFFEEPGIKTVFLVELIWLGREQPCKNCRWLCSSQGLQWAWRILTGCYVWNLQQENTKSDSCCEDQMEKERSGEFTQQKEILPYQ